MLDVSGASWSRWCCRRTLKEKVKGYLLVATVIALIAAIGTGGLYIQGAEKAKAQLAQCRTANEALNEVMIRRAGNTASLQQSCRRNQNARTELERKLSSIATECAIPTPTVQASSDNDCSGIDTDTTRLLHEISEASRGNINTISTSDMSGSSNESDTDQSTATE